MSVQVFLGSRAKSKLSRLQCRGFCDGDNTCIAYAYRVGGNCYLYNAANNLPNYALTNTAGIISPSVGNTVAYKRLANTSFSPLFLV